MSRIYTDCGCRATVHTTIPFDIQHARVIHGIASQARQLPTQILSHHGCQAHAKPNAGKKAQDKPKDRTMAQIKPKNRAKAQ
eukprot:10498703-Heterocapsa_arctica.AAC.1